MVATLKAVASGNIVPSIHMEGSHLSSSSTSGTPVELPSGALVGKSLPDAIKLYLEAVKKKQIKEQIMTALKEGGFESTAADFSKAVSTALHRLKKSGEVLHFPGGGWALESLFPEAFRARLSEHVAKVTKKKGRSGKKRARSKSSPSKAKKADSAAPEKPTGPRLAEAPKGVQQQAREIILASPTRAFQVAELSKLMDTKSSTVALVLGKMVHKGVINRVGNSYQAPKNG